jgi:hypothetical protein
MFAAAYWSNRPETREASAQRLAEFFKSLATVSDDFGAWYLKGRRKSTSQKVSLPTDAVGIASQLTVNRKDVGRAQIPDLGFSIDLWNGGNASLAATVGANSRYVPNSVVLSPGQSLSNATWRAIVMVLAQSFDPDHAVVTDNERLSRAGAARPWDVAWLTYRRGEEVVEHSDRM